MVRTFVMLVVLESVMAFAQMSNHGAPAPSQPTSNSGRPDAGPTNELQMKSIDQVLHDDPKLSAKLQDMLRYGHPSDAEPEALIRRSESQNDRQGFDWIAEGDRANGRQCQRQG
jgi:hypothetical protein